MASTVTDSGFTKGIIAASLIVIVVCIYPISVYASQVQVYSFVCGYIIALLNALAGNRLNTLALSKPGKSFMVIVFGSMGLRMMFIVIFLVILIYFAKLDDFALVGSVFFFYIIFVSIEIFYLHKQHLRNKITLRSENKD